MATFRGLFLLAGLFVQASTASQQCSWDPREAILTCSLTWRQSTARLTFAKHQREATSVLKIECSSDDFKSQKRLRVDYGGGRRRQDNLWPHLQGLEVKNCPLASIGVVLDGLSLENRRGNDILRDVIKPILGGRSLAGLRHLTLSKSQGVDAGESDFSSDLWCEVGSNLVSLNLSSNGMTKVPNTASTTNGSCPHFGLQRLEVLNLADNALSRLQDNNPASLLALSASSLTHLDLSRNRLQSLMTSAFNSLKFVDVSENKLTSWPSLLKVVSASASSLQELHAQGNQMANLSLAASEAVIGSVITFDSLVVLNLSRNALEGMQGLASLGLKQLVALDLSYNRLKSLQMSNGLDSLQVLSLSHNQLVSLGSLASLTRLHVLVLSHNNLDEKGLTVTNNSRSRDPSASVLRHMADLRSLSLDHNRLKSLPR